MFCVAGLTGIGFRSGSAFCSLIHADSWRGSKRYVFAYSIKRDSGFGIVQSIFMTAFEAIIFDCDGVLVDSEVLSVRGERRALEGFGLSYGAADFVHRFVGLHDDAFWAALGEDYARLHGAPAPLHFPRTILAARRAEMKALTIIAGADKALQIDARVGVASSSRAHFLEAKLKRMGLWDFAAPHVYSADLVDQGKPAPDIFLYTAEKMRAAPARCLVLEDSVNGVRAGRAAGMTCWGFLGGGHVYDGHGDRLREAGAHRLINDFDHFLAVMDKENPMIRKTAR